MAFGRSKVTRRDVVEGFGTDEELSALIPLKALPLPDVPALNSRATSCDVEEVVSKLVPAPPLDLSKETSRLPPVAAREWTFDELRSAHPNGASTSGHIHLPPVELAEILDLAERVEREAFGTPEQP